MNPETLRAIRLTLGLTQTQLGARLGVTLRQIQRWEAGDIQIPRGFVVAIGLLTELDRSNRLNPACTPSVARTVTILPQQNYGGQP